MNASHCERLLVLYDSRSINLLKRLCFHSLPQCLLSPIMCVFGLLVKTTQFIWHVELHTYKQSHALAIDLFLSAFQMWSDYVSKCVMLLNQRIWVEERKHALKYTIVPLVQMPGTQPLWVNVPSPLWNQHLLLGHICVRCITFYNT